MVGQHPQLVRENAYPVERAYFFRSEMRAGSGRIIDI